MPINPMDYGTKDTLLDVVRTERVHFFDIVDDPATSSSPLISLFQVE